MDFLRIKDESSSVEVFGVTYQISGYSVLEPGMLVHVYGTPRLYSKTGKFSVYANQIVPAGEGALRLAFERLKEKLEREGLFNLERKRQTPEFPEKIGLITARESRAYGDFIKVLTHRMGGLKILLYPVQVQGRDSVESILRAFNYFNNKLSNLDAIALIRGGGSLEDLQSFNDEKVARAIFSSKVPVICGVGHEDDLTIADLVSDIRASTPSNAAELLVRNKVEVWSEINHHLKTIHSQLTNILRDNNQRIIRDIDFLGTSIGKQTTVVHSLITKFVNQFLLLRREVKGLEQKRLDLQERTFRGVAFWLKQQRIKIDNLFRLLNSFDLKKVLKRGFSITFDKRGKVLKTIKRVSKGSQITTDLFDGKIGSRVLVIAKK
ncbi:MAG: exodeoxyribonuclease VII large subunit [Patescibacteria group bacterium]